MPQTGACSSRPPLRGVLEAGGPRSIFPLLKGQSYQVPARPYDPVYPSYILKALPSERVTLGAGASAFGFAGDTVQSIAGRERERVPGGSWVPVLTLPEIHTGSHSPQCLLAQSQQGRHGPWGRIPGAFGRGWGPPADPKSGPGGGPAGRTEVTVCADTGCGVAEPRGACLAPRAALPRPCYCCRHPGA